MIFDLKDAPHDPASLTLSPTVAKFVRSKADIVMLFGPRREGKTVGGIMGCLWHAERFPESQPLKVAVIRDTWMNLSRTVMESLREAAVRGWVEVEWMAGGTEAILNGGVCRLYLLGMDRPADANRFQGLEIGMAWIEEPAPAADLASGVPADVLGMAMSSMSQHGVENRVQITMNPPDDDHWTMNMIETLQAMGKSGMTVETFWIPPGENPHVTQEFRDKMRDVFMAVGRHDLIARLVEGKIGQVTTGVAVAPEFNELIHVYRDEKGQIAPMGVSPKFESFRFWDFGLNPTVVFCQRDMWGRFRLVGCRVGENMGVEQFVKGQVLPFMEKYRMMPPRVEKVTKGYPRPAKSGYEYRDIGDPSGKNREASSSDRSAVWALERMLGTSFTPGPPDWPARRDSLRHALSTLIGGVPMILIDGTECRPLIRALRGGWRYPKDNAGKVGHLPIKDMHSHPGDALGHGLSVLAPFQDVVKRLVAPERTPFQRREIKPKSWMGR